jgi:hypothetical protein
MNADQGTGRRLPVIPSEARDLAWEWLETRMEDPSRRSG